MMLSRFLRHAPRWSGLVPGMALLVSLLLIPGCHTEDRDAGLPPAAGLPSDTPATLPPTPTLFSTVAAPMPPPEQQVGHGLLPPRPSDPSQVARQAAGLTSTAATTPHVGPVVNAGLIVCDPVSTSPDLTTFGVACGRWLDLIAAGQPELGQTPYWEARSRCEKAMGRTNFQLTLAQAVPLAAMTGATHAACGTITGTPQRCTLTYGLYALLGGIPVGLPLVQTGTEQQVVAALPGLVKVLDTRLGVHAPRIPISAVLSAGELIQTETIGEESIPSDTDLLTLSRLSVRSPLAGMYYLDTRAAYDQILLGGIVKTLLTQLPTNALVLSHIAYGKPGALRAYAASNHALIGRYPASALLAHTEVWEQRVWGSRTGEWQATQRVCRDAPRDPYSWLARAMTLQNIGEDLRQDRLANDLTPSDWAALNRLYSQQEAANLEATKLDPHDGHAWKALAATATFFGDTSQAETAFQKALTLDADKDEVYSWGLQMYQPKWGGSPAALDQIATLATAEPWDNAEGATDTADALVSAGYATDAAQVLADYITRQRVILAKMPTNAAAHWELAAVLAAQKTPESLREATLEYRTAEHLMPNVPDIHHWLGDVLDQRHRATEAISEYRKAIALDPFDASVHLALGFLFKREEHFPEALPELRLALRLDPRNAGVHFALGEILSRQGQDRLAAGEYSEAIRLFYYSLGAWRVLPNVLDRSGQYEAAIQAGREADHLFQEQSQANGENEPPIHDSVADAYLHKKAWVNSIAESNASLGYNPNDALAHENLAEAYIGQGHKKAAQAEWKRTIALNDPQITPAAQKFLVEYP